MQYNIHDIITAAQMHRGADGYSYDIQPFGIFDFVIVNIPLALAKEKLEVKQGHLSQLLGSDKSDAPARPGEPIILFRNSGGDECGYCTKENLSIHFPDILKDMNSKGSLERPFSVSFSRRDFRVMAYVAG